MWKTPKVPVWTQEIIRIPPCRSGTRSLHKLLLSLSLSSDTRVFCKFWVMCESCFRRTYVHFLHHMCGDLVSFDVIFREWAAWASPAPLAARDSLSSSPRHWWLNTLRWNDRGWTFFRCRWKVDRAFDGTGKWRFGARRWYCDCASCQQGRRGLLFRTSLLLFEYRRW